jgi:hypothetical protein
MLPEFVCSTCHEQLEHVDSDETPVTNDNADDVEPCELCGNEITDRYFSISSVAVSPDLIAEMNESIRFCYMEGCGRAWDHEDREYITDTNSEVIELFQDIISGRDETPYLKLLDKIAGDGDVRNNIECPAVRCDNCGVEIDEWNTDITVRVYRRIIPEVPDLPQAIQEIRTTTPVERIEYYRSDCSPYLIHLTKPSVVDVMVENIEGERKQEELEAPEILWLILKCSTLRASTGPGMRQDAVCFTEKPLAALKDTLVGNEARIRANRRGLRWFPYGLLFPKSYLKNEFGVRPVIPAIEADFGGIPEGLQHLLVPYERDNNNWLHEREWRGSQDIRFDLNQCVVLLPDFDQITAFRRALEQEGISVKGFLPLFEVFACL